MAGVRPKLKEFRGNSDEDFTLWFKRFELFVPAAAADAGPEVPRRHQVLPLYLADNAFLTYDSLPADTKANYALVRQALKERLEPQEHALIRREEFMKLRREPEETSSAFELRILRRAAAAFADFPEEHRNTMAKEQFMRGVGDEDLQLHLLTQNPATIRQAAQLAEQFMQIKAVTVPQSVRRVQGRQDGGVSSPERSPSHTQLQQLQEQMNDLSEQMKLLTMGNQNSHRGRGRGRDHGRGRGQGRQRWDSAPRPNPQGNQRPRAEAGAGRGHQSPRYSSRDRRAEPRGGASQGWGPLPEDVPEHPTGAQESAPFEGSCWHCGRFGHRQADCWYRPASN